jgi:hypothetical protein
MKTQLNTIFIFLLTFSLSAQTVFKDEKTKKYGYKDENSKIIIEPKFIYAENFSEGLALVKLKDFDYGFINKKGQVILKGFSYASSFKNGFAFVNLNRYDFIDKDGKFLIPVKYNLLVESDYPIIDNITLSNDNKFEDFKKDWCCDENDADFFNGLVACTNEEGKCGFFSLKTLTEVTPFEYDRLSKFIELENGKMAAVAKKGDFYGVIDDKNNVLLDFSYDFLAWDTEYYYGNSDKKTIVLVGKQNGNFITEIKRENEFSTIVLCFSNLINRLK